MHWEQIDTPQASDSAPSPRHDPCVVAVGSDLYVFGGSDQFDQWSAELFRFSTTTIKWEQLDEPEVSGSLPSARSSPGIAAVGSDVYIFGGYPPDHENLYTGYFTDLFCFSTTTKQWNHLNAPPVLNSLPSARRGHGMVAIGNNFFVFGGEVACRESMDCYSADLFRFSTTVEQWEQLDASQVSGSPPIGRKYHSMAAVGSDLYIFGGMYVPVGSTDSGAPMSLPENCADMFRFSTTMIQWEQLNAPQVSGSQPSGRFSHAMVAVGRDLYLFGGSNFRGYTADLFRFSTTTKHWEQLDARQVLGSPPSARKAHGMVAVGIDLYVFGGLGYDEHAGSDLFRFSTTAKEWVQLKVPQISGSLPRALEYHSMMAVGSDFYVFGGRRTSLSRHFPAELFRFSTTANQWEQLNAPQASGLLFSSERTGHSMVAVGRDLYIFGGQNTDGQFTADLLVYSTARVFAWPPSGISNGWLTRVYDGDIIHVIGEVNLPSGFTVNPCSHELLPCTITITGDPSASSTIHRFTNSRIVCEATAGCTSVTMRHVTVVCTKDASKAGALQISGAGAVATIEGVTFTDCTSEEDGGSMRVYNGATVKMSGTTFKRSSSQVPFLSFHSGKPLTPLSNVLAKYVNLANNVWVGEAV